MILNEKYLRRQNDLQINMLEQEIDTKLLDRQSDEGEQDTGVIETQKAEIDAQIEKYQKEHEAQTAQMRKIMLQIEEAESNGAVNAFDNTLASNEVMLKLREKIVEISDLSMKMDELQAKNDELEIIVRKIETYDKALFEDSRKNKTVQQLTREIQEKALELDKMPRKNRHCVEWFDKYSAKHHELLKKFEDQVDTEQGIFRLL